MMEISEQGWPEPALNGSEEDTLLGSLERQRATFIWKASGVDAAGMRMRVGASELTLASLVKHLAFVEDEKIATFLTGEYGGPWDWYAIREDRSIPWRITDEDTPESLIALWQGAVLRSRAAYAQVLADGGPAALTRVEWDEDVSVRRLLADVIEEYARHTGHADLIREAVDGVVGEDPPDGAPPAAYPPLR
ncbi:DinB family protein [Miniimonas arenae]|uniref:DinB family protein n=1 Tax=Miniimonas arenae TaxID=676201 RepID=A0A5C5BEV7_9MICO|nr:MULTISPECIES: DUF664 domain-containing protein [Miniimonas]TNU75100.1 DinB family protein [Miniimonas arenae]